MSAFVAVRVTGGGTCLVPGCSGAGRFEFFIADYPCLGPYGRELICLRHSREWATLFAELAPSREHLESLIADIGANPTKRLEAINDLRELGFSPDHIALAVKGVAEREEPSQILDRMLGVVELEAVA